VKYLRAKCMLCCTSRSVCFGIHSDEDSGPLLDWSAGRWAGSTASHTQQWNAALHSR